MPHYCILFGRIDVHREMIKQGGSMTLKRSFKYRLLCLVRAELWKLPQSLNIFE